MGALVEPMSVAYHAASLADVDDQSRALIYGGGPIGIGLWFALRGMGLTEIDVVMTTPLINLVLRERRIQGTLCYTSDDYRAVIELMGTVPGAPGLGSGGDHVATDDVERTPEHRAFVVASPCRGELDACGVLGQGPVDRALDRHLAH
jgi:hypothetical protein